MKDILTTVTALLVSQTYASTDGKCRALALSGGGSNGAWEAGVMWGLVHYGGEEDYSWDVISGISAGAFNAVLSSPFAPHDGINMVKFVTDTWTNIDTHKVWKEWPAGTLGEQAGLLDSSPWLQYTTEALQPFVDAGGVYKKHWVAGSIDANNGDFLTFTDKNTVMADAPFAQMASSSVPGIWPPTLFRGSTCIDGGIGWNINIDSAISQCLEIVDDPSDIIVDVLICSFRDGVPEEDDPSPRMLKNYERALRTKSFYSGMSSYQEEARAWPTVTFRNFLQQEHVVNYFLFDPKTVQGLLEMGRVQAYNSLNSAT